MGGSLALGDMPRLLDLLASNAGSVDTQLEFDTDQANRSLLRGRLEADMTLTCQRCLAPVRLRVDTAFELALVTTDEEAQRVQQQYEPLLVEDDTLFIRDVVEDELILALPAQPVHGETEQCDQSMISKLRPEMAPEPEKRENPFARLQELKQRN